MQVSKKLRSRPAHRALQCRDLPFDSYARGCHRNPPYVLHMRRVSAPDPAVSDQVGAFLDLEDEHQFVARLIDVSLDPWEIVLIHSQVGKALGHRKVLKHELLALEALEARESEL